MTLSIIFSISIGVVCFCVGLLFQLIEQNYQKATFFLLLGVFNLLVAHNNIIEKRIMEKLDAIHEVSAP